MSHSDRSRAGSWEMTPEERQAEAFAHTVRQLNRLGFSVDRIAEATGRPVDEIRRQVQADA